MKSDGFPVQAHDTANRLCLRFEEAISLALKECVDRGDTPRVMVSVIHGVAVMALLKTYVMVEDHGLVLEPEGPEPSRRAAFLRATAAAFNAIMNGGGRR